MSEMDLEQRSSEWYAARIGSLGASAVHEVVAKTKSGYSASRANRRAALILERLTGAAQESYQNAAMLHGIETEPQARSAYSFYRDVDVREVGLIRHPVIMGTHASPDGFIGDDGILELKCPQPAAHLAFLMGEPIPDKYAVQMAWQLACSGRAWADFGSFSPSFPEHLRLVVRRVNRDDARIKELEKEVAAFLAEVDAAVASLAKIAA